MSRSTIDTVVEETRRLNQTSDQKYARSESLRPLGRDEKIASDSFIDSCRMDVHDFDSVTSSHQVQATKSLTDFDSTELQHIKDSVQRLRAQRTHVEQLRQANERLERLLAERNQENELLRRETESLRGVNEENIGLLHSFKLLEERIHHLEVVCEEHKAREQLAHEQVLRVERDRDELQVQLDAFCVVEERWRTQHENERASNQYQIDTLVKKHEKQCNQLHQQLEELHRQVEKMNESHAQQEVQHEEELSRLKEHNVQLNRDRTHLETQLQTLLETTLRQTSMIEDCDRALSESKTRQEQSKASYHDQLQLHLQLQGKLKAVETQLTTITSSMDVEKRHLEQRIGELEGRVKKYKDKMDLYLVVVQEKEKQLESMQQEILVRDQNRLHVENVAKDLRKREKALRSEFAELKIALADVTDQRNIVEEEKKTLREQLEKERSDRSRWAAARLELLAEFCDEESKLNSALQLPSSFNKWTTTTRRKGEDDDGDNDEDDDEEEDDGEEDEDIARLIRDSKLHSRRKRDKLGTSSGKQGKIRDPTLVFG